MMKKYDSPVDIKDLTHLLRAPLTVMRTHAMISQSGGGEDLAVDVAQQSFMLANMLNCIDVLNKDELPAGAELNIGEVLEDIENKNEAYVATTGGLAQEQIVVMDDFVAKVLLQAGVDLLVFGGAERIEIKSENSLFSISAKVDPDRLLGLDEFDDIKTKPQLYVSTIRHIAELHGYGCELRLTGDIAVVELRFS